MSERYPYAFTGAHCETTATGTLLTGLSLKEKAAMEQRLTL
jgi:hypothetical protein